MSKNLLMVLGASVDLWAALLITQIWQPAASLEVSMAISDPAAPPAAIGQEIVQIWIEPAGRMGIWPRTDRPLSPAQICRHLEAMAERNGGAVAIRLLCDPRLAIAEWAPAAVQFSRWADEIRIAPLLEDQQP